MGKVSVVSDKWRILGIMRSSVCHTSYCSQKPCLKKWPGKYMFPSLCLVLQRVVGRLRDSLEIEYQEASC